MIKYGVYVLLSGVLSFNIAFNESFSSLDESKLKSSK